MKLWSVWWIGTLVGCGDNEKSPPPVDASVVDAAIASPSCVALNGTTLACDFSCVTTPWSTTAPDPLVFAGLTNDPVAGVVPGAMVEVRAVTGDTLLGQTTSRATDGGGGQPIGLYSISFASGGTAPLVYRKGTAAGHVDGYTYDPTATSSATRLEVPLISTSNLAELHQDAGVTADPARGTVLVLVRDCVRNHVVNATVEVAGADRVFYESNTQPVSPSATQTGVHGWAFAFGVPPGPVDITVRAGSTTYRPWPIKVVANAFTASTRLP